MVTQIDPVVTTATAVCQGQRLAKAAQKVSKRGQKYSRLTHSARVEYYLADWICTHFLVRIGQKNSRVLSILTYDITLKPTN